MKTRNRQTARSIALATALMLCLGAAATATAAPTDCADLPPNHPRYCGPPPGIDECPAEITTSEGFECLWTPSQGAGLTIGTITIEPFGQLDRVLVFVRDASPGDICALEQGLDDTSEPPWEVMIPLEDERGTYWDFTEGHWCEPYDPVAGQRDDPNGLPLHVQIGFKARRGAEARITITP